MPFQEFAPWGIAGEYGKPGGGGSGVFASTGAGGYISSLLSDSQFYNEELQKRRLAEFEAGLSNQSAEAAARRSILANASGMMTEGQRTAGLGELDAPLEWFRKASVDGGMSDGDVARMQAQATEAVGRRTAAMQEGANSQAAARGLSANPFASAAMGMAGQFAGAAAAGQTGVDLLRERNANRFRGAEGMAGVASRRSALQAAPSQQSAAGVARWMGGVGPSNYLARYGR